MAWRRPHGGNRALSSTDFVLGYPLAHGSGARCRVLCHALPARQPSPPGSVRALNVRKEAAATLQDRLTNVLNTSWCMGHPQLPPKLEVDWPVLSGTEGLARAVSNSHRHVMLAEQADAHIENEKSHSEPRGSKARCALPSRVTISNLEKSMKPLHRVGLV